MAYARAPIGEYAVIGPFVWTGCWQFVRTFHLPSGPIAVIMAVTCAVT